MMRRYIIILTFIFIATVGGFFLWVWVSRPARSPLQSSPQKAVEVLLQDVQVLSGQAAVLTPGQSPASLLAGPEGGRIRTLDQHLAAIIHSQNRSSLSPKFLNMVFAAGIRNFTILEVKEDAGRAEVRVNIEPMVEHQPYLRLVFHLRQSGRNWFLTGITTFQ